MIPRRTGVRFPPAPQFIRRRFPGSAIVRIPTRLPGLMSAHFEEVSDRFWSVTPAVTPFWVGYSRGYSRGATLLVRSTTRLHPREGQRGRAEKTTREAIQRRRRQLLRRREELQRRRVGLLRTSVQTIRRDDEQRPLARHLHRFRRSRETGDRIDRVQAEQRRAAKLAELAEIAPNLSQFNRTTTVAELIDWWLTRSPAIRSRPRRTTATVDSAATSASSSDRTQWSTSDPRL